MANIPVTGWSDEVKENMDTVVADARVTLDTRLLSENGVVLPLEVADDLTETVRCKPVSCDISNGQVAYLASLSI